MREKMCSSCATFYPATKEYYGKNKSQKDGLHYYCKECDRLRGRRNYVSKGIKYEYAVYRGDNLISIGTVKEIAEEMGINENSVWRMGTPSYLKRLKHIEKCLVLVRIELDECI